MESNAKFNFIEHEIAIYNYNNYEIVIQPYVELVYLIMVYSYNLKLKFILTKETAYVV